MNDPESKQDERPRRWKRPSVAVALLVETLIVMAAAALLTGSLPAMTLTSGTSQGIASLLAVGIGLLGSNAASAVVVGIARDEFLWPLVEPRHRQVWLVDGNASRLSPIVGVAERVVLTLAGLLSWGAFGGATAAWVAFKVSLDWEKIKSTSRSIGHVYLISSTMSVLFAGLDVLVLRLLFQL